MAVTDHNRGSFMKHVLSHAVEIGKVVLYFFACLLVLQTFRCATLLVANSENQFLNSYTTAALTAAVLGKSVFVLEKVRISRLLDNKPVLTIVIYRTILFTVFTNIILCIEHLIREHSLNPFHSFGDPLKDFIGFAAHQLALFVAFGIFFAVREVDIALGTGTLVKVFLSDREKGRSLVTAACRERATAEASTSATSTPSPAISAGQENAPEPASASASD